MERRAWVLWLHGAGAYGILLLFFWKGAVIWEALRRRQRKSHQRTGFLILLLLLLLTLLLGLLWSFAGPKYLFGFSLLTLHIFLAIPVMILLAWHSWRLRWIWRMPHSLDRRLFLRSGLFALAGWAAWLMANRARARLSLPGEARRFTGSYEVGSFTGRFPITSWIADDPQPVDLDSWRLLITGEVRRPTTLSYQQLQTLATEKIVATLDCTGGFFTTQEWQGVSLSALLDQAGIVEEVRSVAVTSVTGYQRRFSLAEARGFFLATGVGGQPLSHGHGFPVRLVVPAGRGYTWVKWVTDITASRIDPNWQPPLPLQ